jgi:hypothetical protein
MAMAVCCGKNNSGSQVHAVQTGTLVNVTPAGFSIGELNKRCGGLCLMSVNQQYQSLHRKCLVPLFSLPKVIPSLMDKDM